MPGSRSSEIPGPGAVPRNAGGGRARGALRDLLLRQHDLQWLSGDEIKIKEMEVA